MDEESPWRNRGGNSPQGAVAYSRGERGSGPPTFQNVGPQDSHKNVINLGGGVGQICQEEVSEILEKQAKTGFSRVRSKVLVPKKCLNTAGRGFLSQSRMVIFKNFPAWGLASRPTHFNISCYISAWTCGWLLGSLFPALVETISSK